MKIALTQSRGRLTGLEQALRSRGYEVVRSPLLRTEPLLNAQVKDRASNLLRCSWLLFTSPAAVEAWHSLGLSMNVQPCIGVVGKATARRVRGFGGRVRLVAEPATAEGLAEVFLQDPGAASPVGLLRGDRALPTLQLLLEKSGFEVQPVVVYRTVLMPWTVADVEVVVVASPSAVEALPDSIASKVRLIAIGPTTATTVREMGWSCIQAASPEVAAVVSALEQSL